MDRIILGNALSLVGAGLMAAIGLLKKRRTILLVQCVQFGVMGAANLVLGGITGGLSAVVSIARNLLCAGRRMTLPVKLLFSALLLLFGALSMSAGWVGLLPLLSSVLYTWLLDVGDARMLKCSLILAQLFWVVYDYTLLNYVAFVFDIVTIITNVIGLITCRRRDQPPEGSGTAVRP